MTSSEAETLIQQGNTLLDTHRIPEALAAFESATQRNPQHAGAWLMLGAVKGDTGDLAEAERCLRQAITIDPRHADAHLTLASLLAHSGRHNEARDAAQCAVENDPEYAEAWLLLGNLAQATGDANGAERALQRAADLHPGTLDPAAWYQLGLLHHGIQNYQQALHAFDQALAHKPDHAEFHAAKAAAAYGLGQTETAVESYRRALELDPAQLPVYINLSTALGKLGRFDEGVAIAHRAVALKTDAPDAQFNLGRLLRHHGDLSAAITALQTAVSLKPASAEAQLELGMALQAADRYTEAASAYEAATHLAPENIEAHFYLGLVRRLERRYSEAEAAMVRAYALSTERQDVDNQVVALGQMAEIAVQQAQHDKAIERYRDLLRLKPEHAAAQHFLAALGAEPVPPRAADAWVSDLFDRMAGNFDEHLVNKLAYRTPWLLDAMIRRALPPSTTTLKVLDLGCGTGLCGPLLRDLAARLIGVDLSAKMLEKARARGVYDELQTAEITAVLEQHPHSQDLIIAADVLVYFGDFDALFRHVFAALRPGGLFAFSTEQAADDGEFALGTSGRYAHSRLYIDKILSHQGFTALQLETAVLRKEHGNDVSGWLVLAVKPGHSNV